MIESLIWLVPLAVAVLGAWRPRAGLLVFVAVLPFFGAPPGGPYLAALDVACLAAILTSWRGGRADRSPLTGPVAAFVAVSLLSLAPLAYLPPSWRPGTLLGVMAALPGVESWSAFYSWRAAVDLVLGLGLFLAVRRAFAGRSQRPLFSAILVGFAAVLILGLAGRVGVVDLDAFRPKVPLEPWGNRLQSVFFLSGWLSEYLIVVAPLALAVLAAARRGSRWLLALAGASTVLCLALAQSRGAWLAAGAQLLVAAGFVVRRRTTTPAMRRTLVATAVLSAVLGGAVVLASGSFRAFDRPEPIGAGLSSRLSLWSSAGDMLRARPLLGTGLGSFSPAYDRLNPEGSPRARSYHATAHNLYLHVAAERGLIGLGALCLLGVAVAIALGRAVADRQRWAAGVAVSLVGAAAYGLFQYMMHLRNIHWLLWILLASAALCAGSGSIRHSGRAARLVVLAALVVLPLRFLSTETQRYAGDREFGFHEVERNESGAFQWCAGSAATRLQREAGELVLMFANGHPRAGARPVTVAIGIDGEEVATVDVAGGWQEHRIALEPATPESFVLTLRATPSFRPFSEFRRLEPPIPTIDVRQLAVAVREPRWEM